MCAFKNVLELSLNNQRVNFVPSLGVYSDSEYLRDAFGCDKAAINCSSVATNITKTTQSKKLAGKRRKLVQ